MGKRIGKQFIVVVFAIIVFSKVTRPLLSFKRISFETDSVYELKRNGFNPPPPPPHYPFTYALARKVTQISYQTFYLLLIYSGEMAFTQHRLYNEM